MNQTTHGSEPIRNERTGYSPTIDNTNPIPPQGIGNTNYHYTEPNRDSVDLHRILTAAKCDTVEEVCELLERNPPLSAADIEAAAEKYIFEDNGHMSDNWSSFIAGATFANQQREGCIEDIDSIIEKYKDETGSSVFATHTFTNWLKSKYSLIKLPSPPTPTK